LQAISPSPIHPPRHKAVVQHRYDLIAARRAGSACTRAGSRQAALVYDPALKPVFIVNRLASATSPPPRPDTDQPGQPYMFDLGYDFACGQHS
jgi:hypothetical protein